MDQLDIRLATLADVASIQQLVTEAFAPYVDRIGRKPAPMTDDYASHVEAKRAWVLTIDEAIAGLIVLTREADHLHVTDVAVSARYRGRGLGRRLLDHADDCARQLGLDELRLYTNELMHENLLIYPKLGWSEYKRAEDDGFRRVFMRKTLPSVAH